MIIDRGITSKLIKQKILNYTLWLRWDKSIDKPTFNNTDFNNINFEDLDSNFNLFKNLDLKYSDFSNSKFWFFSFTNTDLTKSNFQNTIIENVDFWWCILKWADFRWIKTLPELTKKQLDDIILTDEDYKNYQERKKLEEENKKLKKEVKQKNETIEIIWEKQTDKLIDWFEKLKKTINMKKVYGFQYLL